MTETVGRNTRISLFLRGDLEGRESGYKFFQRLLDIESGELNRINGELMYLEILCALCN